jgi:peptidoglycan/xylan/chitin deacetylase (PgdA/CDA1 family)
MFDRLLGHPLLTSLATRATAGRLRVLGMHTVPDLDALDRQLRQLTAHYEPVGLPEVVEWLDGRRQLPKPSMWITFDDGERSAVVDAAELLARRGVAATMFVCTGFVDGAELPWWEVVESAVAARSVVRIGDATYDDHRAVTALKLVPDEVRREIVAGLPVTDEVAAAPRITLADLRRWRQLGHDIGNHTWDHPCLDQCSPDEQRRQIDAGAAWLDEHDLWDVRAFAYPNGNRSAAADAHLRSSTHRVALLFDHHLPSATPDRFALSLLSLDSWVSTDRARAIASGLHSGLFRVRRRIPTGLLPRPAATAGPAVGG